MGNEDAMSKTSPFFGSDRGVESITKIKALLGASAAKDIIDRLYSNLTILDSKANGLLRVNSFFLTILLAFLGWLHANPQLKNKETYTTVAQIDLVVIIFSCVLCLGIVRISWRFLGQVRAAGDRGYDFDDETKRLANTVDDRTHFYWLAWWGTLIALLMPVLVQIVLYIA